MIPASKLVCAVGCIYELAALPERSPLPTITAVVVSLRRHRALRALAWLWVGFAAGHFLSD